MAPFSKGCTTACSNNWNWGKFYSPFPPFDRYHSLGLLRWFRFCPEFCFQFGTLLLVLIIGSFLALLVGSLVWSFIGNQVIFILLTASFSFPPFEFQIEAGQFLSLFKITYPCSIYRTSWCLSTSNRLILFQIDLSLNKNNLKN